MNPSSENEIPPVISSRIEILLRTSLSQEYAYILLARKDISVQLQGIMNIEIDFIHSVQSSLKSHSLWVTLYSWIDVFCKYKSIYLSVGSTQAKRTRPKAGGLACSGRYTNIQI